MSAIKRRHRIAAALLIVVALCAPAFATPDADARPRASDRAETATEAIARPDIDLRLACRPNIVDGERGVTCRWSESDQDNLRGYQLYRIVNGNARELVATVGAGDRRLAFDGDVSPGDRLIYGVVARNDVGRVIGRSAPVRLTFGAR